MKPQLNKIFQKKYLPNYIIQLKNIIFFCLYVLTRPHLLLLIFKKIYLPVYVQYEWLKKYNIRTVIDIGANHGNVTVALAELYPNADIYAFEPITYECNLIKQKVKRLRHVTVVNAALSNKNGKIPFYVNSSSPSSSMLPLSSLGKKIIPSVTKKNTVHAMTLDTYFKNKKIKQPVFMKIDVQGAEDMVFEGGRNFLKNVSIIHVETGFETVYENQCLFRDIYQTLTHFGFIYHGSLNDSNFYPLFSTPFFENSFFIKKSITGIIQA